MPSGMSKLLEQDVHSTTVVWTAAGAKDKLSASLPAASMKTAPPSSSVPLCFNAADVRSWNPNGFEFIQKLQDAVRNQGEVFLMRDTVNHAEVAVKRMPATWMGSSWEDFRRRHPESPEKPWHDIGCVRYLNNIGYPYVCQLHGVFRDAQYVHVVTSFATEGDLHTWCSKHTPSLESEMDKQPVCLEILRAFQQLHDSCVVHGDVSLENILLSQPTSLGKNGQDKGSSGLQVKLIDFGVASAGRYVRHSGGGKHIYSAPEVYSGENYDGFLADAFSIGVVLYAVMTKNYPWTSTQPGKCPGWGYVQQFGLRSFLEKRQLAGGATAAEVISEPLMQLLEGLLAPDPKMRLTLGEQSFESSGRRSVWDELWLWMA